jgi:hypothetical protein
VGTGVTPPSSAARTPCPFRWLPYATRAPVVVTGIDTVDATNVETEWLGHNLVIPSVLWDVFDLVKNGAPPEKRFGLKRAKILAGSARRFLHERTDRCLVGVGQLRQSE